MSFTRILTALFAGGMVMVPVVVYERWPKPTSLHEELRQAMRVCRYMVKRARHEEEPRWGPGELEPSHVVELLFAEYFEEEWPPRWGSEEHTETELRVMNATRPVSPRHISYGSEPPTEPWTVVAIADDAAGVVHVLGYATDLTEPHFSADIPVPAPPPEVR